MNLFLPSEIIKKKRNNEILTDEEINQFISLYAKGELPDYQMSALLMAIYFNGMNESETLALTKSMLHSGVVVDFNHLSQFKVDKHSTGGVGDKTSLILGPIVAAAGVAVPMISGRGLGHTGGTLDKLESIPGFNTQKSLEEFKSLVEKHLICFIGQTKEICPADKKIYALRDVTATIESLPLICASIMSKKLAEGIDGLVLDVKFGSGAFMKTAEQATELAQNLMKIAQGYGKKVTALITNMNQPLGAFAGNSLEVLECVEIMQGKSKFNHLGNDLYEDTRELSLWLSAHMFLLAGKTKDLQSAYELAKEMLDSGRALAKFKELCQIHGGNLDQLPMPSQKRVITAEENGFISEMNTEKIGVAGILIQAGRAVVTDVINPVAGIEFHLKIGDQVKVGEPIFTIHGDTHQDLLPAVTMLENSYKVKTTEVKKTELILKTLMGV